MRVVWTAGALDGVRAAYDYLVEVNPQAARDLAAALMVAGDGLEVFAERGRMVEGTGLRELVVVWPYVIRYRVDEGVVVILRVRHGAMGAAEG